MIDVFSCIRGLEIPKFSDIFHSGNKNFLECVQLHRTCLEYQMEKQISRRNGWRNKKNTNEVNTQVMFSVNTNILQVDRNAGISIRQISSYIHSVQSSIWRQLKRGGFKCYKIQNIARIMGIVKGDCNFVIGKLFEDLIIRILKKFHLDRQKYIYKL